MFSFFHASIYRNNKLLFAASCDAKKEFQSFNYAQKEFL